MTVQTVMEQLHGSKAKYEDRFAVAHTLFTPFRIKDAKSMIYCKLIELPKRFHFSEEYHETVQKTYGQMLHEVDVRHVKDTLQSRFYLLISRTNLIPLDQLVAVKKQTGEPIDDETILKTLGRFIRVAQTHCGITFNLADWGLNSDGAIVNCDYTIQFRNKLKLKNKNGRQRCDTDSNAVSLSFISALAQLSATVCQHYYKEDCDSMLTSEDDNCCSQCLRDPRKRILVLLDGLIKALKSSQFPGYEELWDTTAHFSQTLMRSESGIETVAAGSQDKTDESPFSTGRSSFAASQSAQTAKKTFSRYLAGVFSIVLLIIAGGVYLYLARNKTICTESYFLDAKSNRCERCTDGCLRCQDNSQSSCFSCRANMYLVLQNENDIKGQCQNDCTCVRAAINKCIRCKEAITTLDISQGNAPSSDTLVGQDVAWFEREFNINSNLQALKQPIQRLIKGFISSVANKQQIRTKETLNQE